MQRNREHRLPRPRALERMPELERISLELLELSPRDRARVRVARAAKSKAGASVGAGG
jgi:hypothetical protein